MLLSDSLTRIRRLLRDTTSEIFSDDMLLKLWNIVQVNLVSRTGILVRPINISVPAITYTTYTHEWERDFVAKPSTLLYNYIGEYTYTQPWEVLVDVELAPAVTGGNTGTQSWEGFYDTMQNRIKHYFPDDFDGLIYAAYDNKPIETVIRKSVDAVDSVAFKTGSGTRPVLYTDDLGSDNNSFYLYMRVDGVYGCSDYGGDYGEIAYDSNDEINPTTDYGVVIFGATADVDSNLGISVSQQSSEDSIYMIYKYLPKQIYSLSETLTLPRFVIKYIEYGVLEMAFAMETDLANEKLMKQFYNMYERGVQILVRLMSRTKSMRTYKLASQESSIRRSRKLADLPSHYESYWR